tara:strand:- start:912 stop:1088 length:177 start_codon:yes stop_codon:yes gene_type:complete
MELSNNKGTTMATMLMNNEEAAAVTTTDMSSESFRLVIVHESSELILNIRKTGRRRGR